MTHGNELTAELRRIAEHRAALESNLQKESGDLSEAAIARDDRSFAGLQRDLIRLFKRADSNDLRIAITLEMIRIMENKLVYLQNFIVEPSADNRALAELAQKFLADLDETDNSLSNLEMTYYCGIAALYAGDLAEARGRFAQVCESEESDEMNDVKYKSFVILGHLSHEARDYGAARDLHDRSVRFTQNDNVTAQALALKALNSYALKDNDEALDLFEQALTLFRPGEAFFNAYFYRNALLFSGAILLQKKNFQGAESFYRQVIETAQPNSYDHFEALSQLGKIYFRTGRFEESAKLLANAVEVHGAGENESLVDTCFWLARAHMKNNAPDRARPVLERVAASGVQYERRAQAMELLRQVS
jgi:tetratricopeptide (TPR) repeat protein